MSNYCLEVYKPDSADSVLASLEADNPFLAINVGDILSLDGRDDLDLGDQVLRVVTLEHKVHVGQDGHAKHKICVFTRGVEDTSEERLS